MMTLTRSPVGRRASTIGFDSSTRRLTVETMRSMVCISCVVRGEAESGSCSTRPARSTKIVVGAVDHDLGDRGVFEERFEDAEAEGLVDDPADQLGALDGGEDGPSRLMMWPSTRSSRARRFGGRERGHLGEVDLLQQLGAVAQHVEVVPGRGARAVAAAAGR